MNEAHKLWGLFVRIQNTEREKNTLSMCLNVNHAWLAG